MWQEQSFQIDITYDQGRDTEKNFRTSEERVEHSAEFYVIA